MRSRLPAVVAALACAALLIVAPTTGTSPAAAHTPHDVVGDVAVSPGFATDGTAFTIVREYLLETTDGGDTWSRLNVGLDNKHNLSAVEVSATDPEVLYAASRGDGVYRSDDGGASFTAVNEGLEDRAVLDLALSPHDHDALYALTTEGAVNRTVDGGATWSPVAGLEGEALTTLAFAPDDPDRVYAGGNGVVWQSSDGGESWDDLDVGDVHVVSIAVGPGQADQRTLHLGTEADGIVIVEDGEPTDEAGDGLTDQRIIDVAQVPGDPEGATLVASTWADGAFRSTDHGATWEVVAEGLTTDEQADELERSHYGSFAVAAGADGGAPTFFLGAFDGLFRSVDLDAGWEYLVTQDSTNIAAVAVSPSFADDGTVFVARYINGAARSEDGGDSWTQINTGLAFEHEWTRREDYIARLTTMAVSPGFATDRTVYAGVRSYLFTSTDAGDAWDAQVVEALVDDAFPPDYIIPAFSPDFADDQTVFAGTDGGRILRWTAGETPELVSELGREIIALIAPAGDVLIASTVDGVYLSDDRGETWSESGHTGQGARSLSASPDFADDQTVFLGTTRGLFRSTDGGSTWSLVEDQPFGDRPYVEAVVAAPESGDGTVLLSARGLGLFRSTDGGRSFEPIGQDLLDANVVLASFYHPTSEPIVFSPTFAEDRTVFGIAESTVFRSTDAGDTWTALEVPRATHPLDRASAPNDLLVVPRPDELAEGSADDGFTLQDRSASEHTVLVLSTKRILAAVAAGVLALGLFWAVRLGSRSSEKWLAIYVRIACAGLVSAVALFFLSNR